MKALEADSGGKLNARDKRVLEELQRDVARVRKAREAVGDKVPKSGAGAGADRVGREAGGRGARGGVGRDGILGKRPRHAGNEESGEGSETDESVRAIPMPRDTPPPIPSRYRHRGKQGGGSGNANLEPLGEGRGGGEREPHALPDKPPEVKAQTVYEAKPAVRDLRKEAVNRFVPTVVQRKLEAKRGEGGRLLEEDEVEKLEKEGYGGEKGQSSGAVVVDAAPRVGDDGERRLEQEEERFERELRGVQIEEVEDEDL